VTEAAAERGQRPARAGWLGAARRRPWLAALGLGAMVTLALPPVHFWPALIGFAGLLHLVRHTPGHRRAFLIGWCFGLGHFLTGLYWIGIAFFTDPERFGALAVPAVVLLCAWLAVFAGLASWLVGLRRWRSTSAAALALALAWMLAEVLRGNLLLGFPWNLIGYAWAGSDAVSQLAAVTGVYGLSLLAVALGALPASLLEPGGPQRWRPVLAGALVLALLWAGGTLRLAAAEGGVVPDVRLRLVQGNIAQHHKWQPELRARWFQRHLELSAQPPREASLVIWPESATPYPLEQDEEARLLIAQVVPAGGVLLTGGERFDLGSEPARAWNSLFALDPSGAIVARYDKRDLVPFGEYLPLRELLGRLGLGTLTRGTLDFQPGPGRTTIALPGVPPFSPLICYEVIFPGQVLDPAVRPAWLLNVTNDAWFGRSSGPYQHLTMARLRAIEEGLPLVRSANTGISAVIDPWGRIEAELALGTLGVLDVTLPQPLGALTPFARWGRWWIILLASTALIVIVIIEVVRSRTDLRA
jgi:apolipoprotein N-acyltransferase